MTNVEAVIWQYLSQVYQHGIGNVKTDGVASQSIAETYGEILPESVSKILSAIKIDEHDVFVDLGSGLGKLVLQVFLTANTKEVRGIEISRGLHQRAQKAIERVQNELPEYFYGGRKLALYQGDFLTTSIEGATVVLIGSPCFGPDILNALAEKIDKTKTIHTVITLRPLLTIKRLVFKRMFRVECTWDSAQCYLYQSESKRKTPSPLMWQSILRR